MENRTSDDYVRLGRAVENRRREIGMARTRLAQIAGVDPSTLFDLEKARRTNFSENTLDSVFNALQWPPWTWRDVLDGRSPSDIVEPLSADLAAEPGPDLRDVGSRRLVSAVEILESVYETLLRSEVAGTPGLVLAAIHMVGAGADALGLDDPDLTRARNATAHYPRVLVAQRRQRETTPSATPAHDPSVYELVAADAPGEPTDAEMRDQDEAAREEAEAAEERRRQDENDEGA